jgi:hypothetical protein
VCVAAVGCVGSPERTVVRRERTVRLVANIKFYTSTSTPLRVVGADGRFVYATDVCGVRRIDQAPERSPKFLITIDKTVPAHLGIHLIYDNYGTHKTSGGIAPLSLDGRCMSGPACASRVISVRCCCGSRGAGCRCGVGRHG